MAQQDKTALDAAMLPPEVLARIMSQLFGSQSNVKMSFQVEPHTHKRVINAEQGGSIFHYERKLVEVVDDDGEVVKRMKLVRTPERVEEVKGFMVYFPAGHSVFFESEEQLKRYGLTKDAELVDMNTGLSVNEMSKRSMTPKQIVTRNTRNITLEG